jgi:hypothetical protein
MDRELTIGEIEACRDMLERLISDCLLEARWMDYIISTYGEHYTYRDKQRFSSWMAQELERQHLYLVKYDESSKRLRELRERVALAKIPSEPKGTS